MGNPDGFQVQNALSAVRPMGDSSKETQRGSIQVLGGTKKPSGSPKDSLDLSDEALAEVAKLRQIDQKVRAHEQAHLAASGGLARSGASYQYQRGPDGQMYAVAGEVSIDVSPVPNDPRATLRKAQQAQAAALAPADPSGQDRAVASAASAMAAQASMELAQQSFGSTPSRSKGQGLGGLLDITA